MADSSLDKAEPVSRNATLHPDTIASEARQAAEVEQQMTLWQAVKTYPHAVGWSVLFSTTLIMEGYDLALLGNLYASVPFNRKYGHWVPAQQKYQVSAAWQSGLSNGARAGEIFGLVIAGWTADRWGAKKTMIGFLLMMIATIFALFFAPNVTVLVVGEVLCGM
jgi:SP family general alpha glucoside:H+ symporter-like MFS transporter